MIKKRKIDPAYYENRSFADDFLEAKKNGTLIVTRAGENPLEAAIKRHVAAKKKQVGLRLASGVICKIKTQAAAAGIPWTTYMGILLERAVAEPQDHAVRTV